MRLIVLDAGDSFELDGFNKLLLTHPVSNKTIIEEYEQKYEIGNIDIVVGYNAVAIINAFPKYNYIYNSKWQTTNNSYSLSLALDGNTCIVTSSDLFIKQSLVEKISQFENCVVIKDSDNKTLNSLNVKIENEMISSVYYGKSSGVDFELMGIFKITDTDLLKRWKKNCIINPNMYAGENLPLSSKINVVAAEKHEVVEINSTQDYINFIAKT